MLETVFILFSFFFKLYLVVFNIVFLDWTFHAKGLWATLPGQDLPYLTTVGSPNFGMSVSFSFFPTRRLIAVSFRWAICRKRLGGTGFHYYWGPRIYEKAGGGTPRVNYLLLHCLMYCYFRRGNICGKERLK